MKTLKDHVIIYDDECPMCPMCDLYTGAFVKTKMLDEKGREPYSWLPSSLKQHIDTRKACNEIALVNYRTGSVTYGVDSLFTILGHRFRFLKPLFLFTPFRLLMKHVYSFISYNRRVIIPAEKFDGKNSCTPDFNLKYRVLYIVFTWLATSFVLNAYSLLLSPLMPTSDIYREFLVCGGQIAFQAVTILFLKRDRLIHYLGNMMTISFAGAMLLLPALAIHNLAFVSSPYFYAGWFLVVAGLMLVEHVRRMKILNIHWTASVSWVLYRIIVLLVIL
jgi:hypothetical protein